MQGEKLADAGFACYASNARELNAKGAAAATRGGLIAGSKGALPDGSGKSSLSGTRTSDKPERSLVLRP